MPEYLIRCVQQHESFRKAELEALATLTGVGMEFISYSESTPFALVTLPSDDAARALITRSILSLAIYELWGSGATYPSLHASVTARTSHRWAAYATTPFRFSVDAFQGKRSTSQQRDLINSFRYLSFRGPIRMRDASLHLCIFEEYEMDAPAPTRVFLGRWIADGGRKAVVTYDLKKRAYISTTSMDAELALVTANMALAAPGKCVYDPFVGTGSFTVAAAHFGAVVLGSDIDGRSVRGKGGKGDGVVANFRQYGLVGRLMDDFVGDLTNSPLRRAGRRWLDGIVCDPPYGVREGLKVLGRKDGGGQEAVMIDGVWAHLREGYIPPKKPYSFEAMLDDIMEFATDMLVDEGRLSMWMPTANDEDVEFAIPSHPCLQLVSVCVQPFNKWSRRLLTYRRIPDAQVDKSIAWTKRTKEGGGHADDLNSFRRKYFQGFKPPEDEVIPPSDETSAAATKQGAEQLPEQVSGLKLSDEDANQKSESK
ncbi:tRNA guanosine-2'-O-methyltransferas-like protein TRM11 [Macrophomina phaseolina]|uniref:tRNA (guanine(10)-N(2))-methyltransferase n=1 Tax=Macrophomina phaseolina TaxID=35725 RepID=A0ABQ8FUF9_9PEZI|nr:tRNA guanosine-2'-O-methyltransferas-like protein TRM11 [Macrophomina phaseolina]